MIKITGLMVGFLYVTMTLGGPTKPAEAENEVGEFKKSLEVPSPILSPPTISTSPNEPTFTAVSAQGEGQIYNEEFGYAGKGAAAGVAGAVVHDKGVTGGGAGYAAGIAGVDTVPFKGFIGLSTNQQGTFNTYGEPAQPFVNDEDIPDELQLPVKTETKPVDETKSSTVPLTTVAQTVNTLFRPISSLSPSASLFNTLTGGIFQQPAVVSADALTVPHKVAPVVGTAPRDEDESAAGSAGEGTLGGIYYTYIRPITPTGIVESVSGMLKPLTSLSGQAQGSITLTGGASYTGNPPEPVHKPPPPPPPPPPPHYEPPCYPQGSPCHQESPPCPQQKPPCHPEKPCPPCHKPPPVETPRVRECKAQCHKNGKPGGAIYNDCCTCSCPAPEVPKGQLCCSDSHEACEAHCKHNPFHSYVNGGFCFNGICECRCLPWEPCWKPPPSNHGYMATEEE